MSDGVFRLLTNALFQSTLVAAAAWLVGKAWELQAARRTRYGELAKLLASLGSHVTTAERSAAILECSRLWVEAPTPVVIAAEAFLDALDADAAVRDAALKRLVIAMRRDTALWAWLSPARWRRLCPPDFRLRLDE